MGRLNSPKLQITRHERQPARADKTRLLVTTLCLLILLSWSNSVQAQQVTSNSRDESQTFGFVSPNTLEGLKLEQAIKNLDSKEVETLIRDTRRLGCIAQTEITPFKAVGSWSDGAEHSVMFRLRTNKQTIRYIVSQLGKKFRQKAVLFFRSEPSGSAEMYSLQIEKRRGPIRRIAQMLDEAGIQFRTLVPTRKSLWIYVVDLNQQLRSQVTSAARRLKARMMVRRGSAEFIGDDASREKAANIFNGEISDFEATHPKLVDKCRAQEISHRLRR